MRVVVDTNIFISAVSRFSADHWLVDALVDEKFEVVFSTEIFLEYEEKLLERYNPTTVYFFLKTLEKLPNSFFTSIYYNWNLLSDPDDNKFVDAAFAAGADFILSEDRVFQQLKKIDFPQISVLTLAEFKAVLFPT